MSDLSDYCEKIQIDLYAVQSSIDRQFSAIKETTASLETKFTSGVIPSVVELSGQVIELQRLLARLYCLHRTAIDLAPIERGCRDETTV